ncbi:MAG: ATP-binding protein [Rhizobiaceae bacterium]
MRATFVEVENVDRFLAGREKVEHRGAPESSWHLVMGEPGFGKTRTLTWHHLQTDCVLLRAKAGWTPTWALRDLVSELGLLPARSRERLYEQATMALAVEQRTVIVDEIDHAMGDRRIIETFRDISDEVEVPIIIGGMKGVEKRLKRYPQIYSRINSVTEFQVCSVEDVQRCCDELCEVELADDIALLVLAHTGGRLREVINYIAELERIGKRSGEMITADSLQGRILTNDGKSRTGQRAA